MRNYDTHGEYRTYDIDVCKVIGEYLDNFEQEKVLKYSLPVKDYSQKFQSDINVEIEDYMQRYGATREEVVSAMLEQELEIKGVR